MENSKNKDANHPYIKFYHLRWTKRKCLGKAKYNITNSKIEINQKCSIQYEKHSYI